MANARTNKPWWEQRPKAPGEGGFEAERERLRAELARAWRALAASQQNSRRNAAAPLRAA
jgi:hypothetical protein